MDIGSTIRNKRKELDLTLKDVAKIVGVTDATVQRWESGKIESMRCCNLKLLCKVLQLDPVSLIMDDSEQGAVTADDESRLLEAYRSADDTARDYALDILLSHPKKAEKLSS